MAIILTLSIFVSSVLRFSRYREASKTEDQSPKHKVQGLSPKTRDHPLVNFPRHAHVVEIVFADLRQACPPDTDQTPCCLRPRLFCSIRFPGPRDVVKTHATTAIAQPPLPHRVENAAHVVLTEIHERSSRDAVHQTALKNKRQIETDDVVADEFVDFRIEAFMNFKKSTSAFFSFCSLPSSSIPNTCSL